MSCWKKWLDVLVFKKSIINFNWCSLSPLFKLLDVHWWTLTGYHVVLAIINTLILNNVLQFCVGILMLWINCFLNNRNCRYYEKKVQTVMSTIPQISTQESQASTWIPNVMCPDLYCGLWSWGQIWLFALLILMELLTILIFHYIITYHI